MHKLFGLLILLLVSFSVYAQSNLKLDHLNVEDGLSNNFIRAIAQDSAGFMWFATEDGLNKYDGYTFTVYRHDPTDSTSLSENKVEALLVAKDGVLWVGTNGGGLNAFNTQKEEFTRYNMDHDDPHGNSMEYITDIYQDNAGNIWFAVQDKGLYCLDPTKDKFIRYAHDPDNPNTINSHKALRITSTMENGNEILWLGTWGSGLNKYDLHKKQWTHFRYDPLDSNGLCDDYIDDVYTDHSGILWVTTAWNGLHKMDPVTECFTVYRHDPSSPSSLSDNMGGEMWEKNGFLWITSMNGLSRLNIANEKIKSWFNNPSDPHSLGQNSHWRIFESRGGMLWIGGWAGIDIIDFEQKPFVSYQRQPGNPNSLSDNFVGAIRVSQKKENDIIWIGTKDGGLNKINRSTGQYTHYTPDQSDPNSLSSWFIFSIAESSYKGKKELWMGTMAGLNRFDPQNGKFKHYNYDPGDTTSVSEDLIHKVYACSNGYIWVGTQNGGLCRFDPVTQKFKRYHHSTGEVWGILEDSAGFLWHGSVTHGLMKLDPQTNQLTYYKHDLEDTTSISSNTIRSLHESYLNGRHLLWVGTNAGLNRFDYSTQRFYNYSRKDGLPSDEINSILEDEKGNLWLGTGYGLSKFDPVYGTVRNYDKDDGLPGNQFLRGSYFMTENGEMFFGSTSGFTSFFPDQIKDNPFIPQIVLTDFQLFNKSVPVKKDSLSANDIYSLPQHISVLNQITLAYNQNIFSFEFAALDFRKPQKNRYAYMMEGIDPDWVYTDASRRYATYTNLDPGAYTFRVKGSNNDGLWNVAGKSIKIIITPPWWETQIAYFFYFLFFIVLIAATWHLQLRRIHLKQQVQMEQFESQKLREIDHMKSNFFANISHEFRTPLTLIEGPINQMLSSEFTGNMKEQFKMILRNTGRLLTLVNQLLELSKLESDKLKLKIKPVDIVRLTNSQVQAFESLARQENIRLKFFADVTEQEIYIDIEKYQTIINNLLSNAFKATAQGGEVQVNITNSKTSPMELGEDGPTLVGSGGVNAMASPNPSSDSFPYSRGKERKGCIQIAISNTGTGIPFDQLDHIFDRFYQIDNSYQKDGQGTGIGLALSKELVELHHGRIWVESKRIEHPPKPLSKGVLDSPPFAGEEAEQSHFDRDELEFASQNIFWTTFHLLLPLGKEHLKENEIIDTPLSSSTPVGGQALPRGDSWGVEPPEKISSARSLHAILSEGSSANDMDISNPKTKILIVEDNAELRSFINSTLQDNYNCLEAENGQEGFKRALEKIPDLIISDVMMPEMDGYAFCQKIKNDERISHIPLILLTARAAQEDKIYGLESGADDYISKPFDNRELQVRVKNLIEQRRKLQEKFSRDSNFVTTDIATTSADEKFIKKIMDIITRHISDTHFQIETLAQEAGLSRTHLHRKISGLFGQSAGQFLRTVRMKQAVELLRKKAGNISEIAYAVGFDSPAYFSNCFKKQFGSNPSDYMNNLTHL